MPAGIKKKTKSSTNVGKSNDCNSLPSSKKGKPVSPCRSLQATTRFMQFSPPYFTPRLL